MRRPPDVDAVDWALRFCWLNPNGCWVYMRPTDRCGYAQVQHEGRLQMAHRLVYEREVGPIPDGLEIDHLCREKACLNPAHLEVVSRGENIRRSGAHFALPNVRKHHGLPPR